MSSATRRFIAVLVFVSSCLALLLQTATPARALFIRGDPYWRGSEACAPGWTEPGTDDSAWKPITYPWLYIWPRDWPGDLNARPFWADSDRDACVRRHFALATPPRVPATVHVWVDDDYDLYINGTLVGASHDQWGKMPGETYDVTSLLKAGDNVIAMKLIDCGGTERGALFSLELPGVPDPPPRLSDLVFKAKPWVRLLGIILVAVTIVVAVRRLGGVTAGYVRRLPAPAITVAMIALTLACEALLLTRDLYTAPPAQPWASWNWTQMAVTGSVLVLLFVLSSGDRDLSEPSPPRHAWLTLTGILLLAAFLRMAWLNSMPPGFFQDEAINGNDALALFDGRPLELWSDSIGGRPTLFLYLLGACLHVLGPTYLALKVLPVTIGILSVAAMYVLGRIALGRRAALWSTFFLAISFWHIHFTRMAWEVDCVPLLSIVGFALLLHGLGPARRPTLSLIAAGVVLAIGLYTYAAYRAVPAAVVVFIVATAFADWVTVRKRMLGLLGAAFAAAVVLVPLGIFAWRHPDLYWTRFTDVALTKYIGYFGTPFPWAHQFGKALLSLHQYGDAGNLTASGQLDVVTATLLLLGIVAPAGLKERAGVRLCWVWFLTFMALASLTRDSPHATRMLGALPPALLLAGLGTARLFAHLKQTPVLRRLAPVLVVAVVLSATALNAYQYFIAERLPPDGDVRSNGRARTFCALVAAHPEVKFSWTFDMAYWCSAQCAFLKNRRFDVVADIKAADLLDTRGLRAQPSAAVAVGQEFLDTHPEVPRDVNGVPTLDLPARPVVTLDHEARPMYYLYRWGESPAAAEKK